MPKNTFLLVKGKTALMMMLVVLTLISCLSENEITDATSFVPIAVKTSAAKDVTSNSATVGGELSAAQKRQVTRGICWGTTENPTTSDNDLKEQGELGTFSFNLSNLQAATTYYIRAYANNPKGIVYGTQQTFKTAALTTATISTNTVTGITSLSAISGGTITTDGGSAVIARGICWNTNQNPTIDLTTKTNEGIGIGTFTSSMINLQLGVTYYVRAYATNALGTSYGTQLTFTTNNYASITTNTVTNITTSSATCGGNIISDGGSTITGRGVCWSTLANPTINDSKTSETTGTGSYNSSITGLLAGTTYNVRAYCTNSLGTVYGANVIFTTSIGLPSLTTNAISGITSTTATSGGNIISNGGGAITARGVCWSTNSNPTITNSITSDGIGTSSFSSSITGLTSNTTYYVRAYATNATGTAYGSQVSFTTSILLSIPTLSTTVASSISTSTASSGGNISSDGGATITARGVCWSTATNPTISNSKTSNGTGTGVFSSSITGLLPGTSYYVRAYATNSVGTAYGTQINFSTVALAIGQSYQGGIIAYIFQSGDPGYVAGESHGLIAAPTDQSTGIQWFNGSNINIGTATTIGSGNTNTTAIVNKQGIGNYAAKLCSDLVIGIYNDWYLPSKDELDKLYINRSVIGGFNSSDPGYWSSSEYSISQAWVKAFAYGYNGYLTKSSSTNAKVRAIRSF